MTFSKENSVQIKGNLSLHDYRSSIAIIRTGGNCSHRFKSEPAWEIRGGIPAKKKETVLIRKKRK